MRPAPPPEHTVLLKFSLEAFHRKQPGRFCCSRSCYLPLNGVRKPFCLLAGKQRDAETSSLFTASLCGCCCLCSAVSVVFAAVPCIQMWGRTTNVRILKKRPSFCRTGSSCRASVCCFDANLHFGIVVFFLLLIQEHTLVSHTHALNPVHKSHSVSHTHTHLNTHMYKMQHKHTLTHTLLTPAVAFCRPRHFDEPGAVCECS